MERLCGTGRTFGVRGSVKNKVHAYLLMNNIKIGGSLFTKSLLERFLFPLCLSPLVCYLHFHVSVLLCQPCPSDDSKMMVSVHVLMIFMIVKKSRGKVEGSLRLRFMFLQLHLFYFFFPELSFEDFFGDG
jgi:hypothetical protein